MASGIRGKIQKIKGLKVNVPGGGTGRAIAYYEDLDSILVSICKGPFEVIFFSGRLEQKLSYEATEDDEYQIAYSADLIEDLND